MGLSQSCLLQLQGICEPRMSCGVVEAEGFAFEKHSVVIDQYGTVNEFEDAFAVIQEVADCVECVGVVSFGLNLETQLDGLALGDFVAVEHDFHRERIGLLHVEVVRAGGESKNEGEGLYGLATGRRIFSAM